jgi:hypothetical protein
MIVKSRPLAAAKMNAAATRPAARAMRIVATLEIAYEKRIGVGVFMVG